MEELQVLTGAEAGLSIDDQIKIALKTIITKGGTAQMSEIYVAVEQSLNGVKLSDQGKASLRKYVNNVAVQAGYIYPHDPNNPGWKITPEGKEFLETESVVEEVTNVDTEQPLILPSNAARGAAFENYILLLLKKIYPNYSWYSQGVHKNNERGLDFIGSQIGKIADNPQFIGVQVKFHAVGNAPTQIEWLKFLAGCFARQVEQAIFITTGRLTSEQRREAGEARVIVIEGRDEVIRISNLHGLEPFEFFEQN